MRYDFDELIMRKNTNCLKYDQKTTYISNSGQCAQYRDIIPMWVADMDFAAPPQVLDALESAVKHGVFGYPEIPDSYYDAVINWFCKRHGYYLERDWIVPIAGVVYALYVAVRAFTEPGDAVLIQTPVYPAFFNAVNENNRRLVTNVLNRGAKGYSIDFEDFERKIVDNRVRLFILCNPHNPVGRVWTELELAEMGRICLKHGCIVVSDEIHCDIVYPHHRHILIGSSPELQQCSVICTAPSKTFNIPGLHAANTFIADKKLRDKFVAEQSRSGHSHINMLGVIACEASYAHGEEWLDQLLAYLRGNISFLSSFLKRNMPSISFTEPEGTFLAWLGFQSDVGDALLSNAMVRLSPGSVFGRDGIGYQRMNIACPRATLEKALRRISDCKVIN